MKFKTKTRFVESFWGGVESFWGGIPISPILNYSFWVRAGEVAVALCSKCMGFHQNASSPNIQPAQSPWLYIYTYLWWFKTISFSHLPLFSSPTYNNPTQKHGLWFNLCVFADPVFQLRLLRQQKIRPTNCDTARNWRNRFLASFIDAEATESASSSLNTWILGRFPLGSTGSIGLHGTPYNPKVRTPLHRKESILDVPKSPTQTMN